MRPAKSEEGPGSKVNNKIVRGMREKKFFRRGKRRRRWEGRLIVKKSADKNVTQTDRRVDKSQLISASLVSHTSPPVTYNWYHYKLIFFILSPNLLSSINF